MTLIHDLLILIIISSIIVFIILELYLHSSSVNDYLKYKHWKLWSASIILSIIHKVIVAFAVSFLILIGLNIGYTVHAQYQMNHCVGIYHSFNGNFNKLVVTKRHIYATQENDSGTKTVEKFDFKINKIKKNGYNHGIILYGQYLNNAGNFDHSHDGSLLIGSANHGHIIEMNPYGDVSRPGNPHFDSSNCLIRSKEPISHI